MEGATTTDLVAHLAISLEGLIAKSDGSVPCLDTSIGCSNQVSIVRNSAGPALPAPVVIGWREIHTSG